MLFSNKSLYKIIIPLFIEQILAVTIGMLDSVMVSSVGEAAVSGVSLVDTVNLLLSYIFSALATGGAVVSSQFLGRKEYDHARSSAKQLLYSVVFTASIITAIVLVSGKPMLSLLFGNVEADVMGHARIYFLITSLSYPFLALYNGGAALFRSMGNSKISMSVSMVMNFINFSGNALLIFGFHLGAAGAAAATLFSRIVGSVIMTVLLHDRKNVIYIEKLFSYRPDFKIIKSILGIGIPSGMENGMFQFGKILTQSLISAMGTAVIAANAVAGTLSSFVYAVGGAVGLTLVTVVGRCVGAGEFEQAKFYSKKLMKIEYTGLALMNIFLILFGKNVIAMYNLSPYSTDIAYKLLMWHALFNCTIWAVSFTLPNSFRAASDVRFPMIVSILSMWIFRVGLSYLLVLYFDLGIMGVWFAMFADWIFRGSIFATRFVSGKWLTKYKPPQADG